MINSLGQAQALEHVLGRGACFCCLRKRWKHASSKQEGGQGARGHR